MLKKILLISLIFITISLNAQMVLEYNTELSEGTTITVPLNGTVDVSVDWGDGTTPEQFNTPVNANHTYSTEGIYTVSISGTLSWFGFSPIAGVTNDKLTRCISFGDVGLSSLSRAFYKAKNLIQVPSQIPGTIENLSNAFQGATLFNQDLNNWDVSNVSDMNYMFMSASSFNQNIGNWNVSKVTNMSFMFYQATAFNQNISTWNVSNVKNMRYMFSEASNFNQDIGNWNVSNVTDMGCMFLWAEAFNQDIGNWDVSKVTDMVSMFNSLELFNQNISRWDVSSVINMSAMFFGAKSFNQDIGNWDVSNVTDMGYMFNDASSFNSDIGDWDVSNVKWMDNMFYSAESFNQDIGSWDVSNVTTMREMFMATQSFNQDIGNWDVSSVTDMSGMFWNANAFNQGIGDWDVSNVEDMSYMFHYCPMFNQDIGNWDVSNVINTEHMFNGAYVFNQDIGRWDVSKDTCMAYMFGAATSFNQDISNWDVSNVENMTAMFGTMDHFNQPIGKWNVGKVKSMAGMFYGCKVFNQDLSEWDVSNVTNMSHMFPAAFEFDQDISSWDVSSVTNMYDMFAAMQISTPYYNNLLKSWSSQQLQSNVIFSAGWSNYSPGESADARQSIIDTYNWTIMDNGESGAPSILTNPVENISFTSATSGGNIVSDAGSSVTDRGIVWDTLYNPTLEKNKGTVTNGTGTGLYSCDLNGLTPGNTYYARAYATNSNGTAYGHTKKFIPQKALTLTGVITANSKTYDGTNAVETDNYELVLTGIESGHEDIALGQVKFVFEDKNAGNDKAVIIKDAVFIGSDSLKYFLSSTESATTTATIEPKTVTISGDFSVKNKTYNGTTNAIIKDNNLVVDGKIRWDDLTLSNLELNFAQPEIGSNILVSITSAELFGADSLNYVLSLESAPTCLGNIVEFSGIPNSVSKDELLVYPNPFNDYIVIQNNQEIESVSLHNILGKTVFTTTETMQGNIKISTEHLPRGTYFITFRFSNNTEQKTLPIIKL
ncbi:MAG: BspA family leucine-rich repeat surface protein [Bacteroidales bacterium]|nr:BspA family leucine-rich repeat surface protein [Bacteroidales bacterium]MBN2818003.1 BspA family leucine-rich repeat surface protein [Bacteroidales bacterium]